MAAELQQDYLSAKTVYFLIRNSIGQIWNGSAFVAYVTANYALYPITGTEQGTSSGFYTGTFPAAIAGIYSVIAKQQVGGSPAETDITIGTGTMSWSSVSVVENPFQTVRTGTVVAGSQNTVTLDAAASAVTTAYVGLLIYITGGPGVGQVRTVLTYVGSTKICTVDRPFQQSPTSASTFALLAADNAALNANLQVTVSASQAVIRSGTAQTGSTTNTIKLDSGASATNSIYVGNVVTTTGGTGLGQSRTIVSYNGSTKVATVDRNWVTVPDNTTTFNILANITPTTFSDQGVAQAGASGSITLAPTASAVDSIYVGSIVTILSGTDAGDTSEITAYNGTTKVATVVPNFAVAPDSTSGYAVIPTASGSGATVSNDVNVISIDAAAVAVIVAGVWDDPLPGSHIVGSAGYIVGNMATLTELEDQIWDATLTLTSHNNVDSSGRYLRLAGSNPGVVDLVVIRSGTAQAGSTVNTIKLDSGALATNNIYNGDAIVITSGTGLGQTRTIVAYNGSTKVATVDRDWTTTPDNTSVFSVLANINPSQFSDTGIATAATASSITLAVTASPTSSIYVGSLVTILSGTGAGSTSVITAYNGGSKVATVSPNFAVTPDATSAYAVIPTASATGSTNTADVNVISWAGLPVTDTFDEIVAAIFRADMSTQQASAAIQSLCSVVLKLTSRFNALTGRTYRTDGTTIHMTQTPVTNASMVPIEQLGVGA